MPDLDTAVDLAAWLHRALLAAACDAAILALMRGLWQGDALKMTIFRAMYLGNWFILAILGRNYSNTYECLLLFLSLHFYQQNRPHLTRILLTPIFMLRPTGILPLAVLLIYDWISQKMGIKLLATNLAAVGAMLACSAAFDGWWYGPGTFTAYHFARDNLAGGVASLYGVRPFWFYAGAIIPYAVTLALPLLIAGLVRDGRRAVWLLLLAFWSALPHKEERFIGYLIALSFYFSTEAAVRYIPKPRLNWFLGCYLVVNAALFWFNGIVLKQSNL